jgi:hypothetical protein
MECKILTNSDEFLELGEDWKRIAESSKYTTYFSTFNYNYYWWETNKSNRNFHLFIIVVYDNSIVVGIAPLKINNTKKKLFSSRVLEFLTHGDYADFLVDISSTINKYKIINEIFFEIESNNALWDEISLTHICQNTILSHFLLKSNMNKSYSYLNEVPFINFENFRTFDIYTKLYLPKKLKQYLNRLQREVNFKIVVTNKNNIKELSEIHIAQKTFLNKKGQLLRHSFYEDEQTRAFLEKLYENNLNILTYLMLDTDNQNQIICYYTGYVYNNVFHSYNTAYNPKYHHLAVGKIFYYLIFEKNYKDKLWDIFDMGTGRYLWKFEWTDTFNLLYQLNMIQNNRRKIKALKKIENLLSSFKQLFRS